MQFSVLKYFRIGLKSWDSIIKNTQFTQKNRFFIHFIGLVISVNLIYLRYTKQLVQIQTNFGGKKWIQLSMQF